ncbi:CDP-glycerol glycerophosphotransferase family protein [Nesterenkonia ebinurensis]|uniref:CDP-glycerol glycerophosphotransferase family protein n=1 Tax=Nesterenkonia ebinurensis TaxID=2608252 RepID=UPI00168BE2B3|nr:CDP-glycerol glycerophosphotransferase family protein [Nesterenkonia ebinurensis]
MAEGSGDLEKRILTTPLGVMVAGARGIYALLKLLPVQRKVVLITREPKQITVDFTLLKQAIRRSYPEHEIVVIKHKKLSATYIPRAFREMYHLATCAGCLVDGYIIPVSILNHRKNLKIGQIWHALGAIKKFGHLASGTREGPNPRVAATMRMHQNYSFVCASGEVPASIYTAAFGIPAEKIQPLGMPRIDYLLDEQTMAERREQIMDHYPRLRRAAEQGGHSVLYIPTFRRGKHIPYTQVAAAFQDHAEAANTLVLLPHPMDKSPVPESGSTIIGTDFGVLDWLAVADAVITDYSAVTYEAALRDIPLVFWPYDLADYTEARGLAVDYHAEVPGPIVTTATEAVKAALSIGTPDYRKFRAKHLSYVTEQDGSLPRQPPACADRIVDALDLGS